MRLSTSTGDFSGYVDTIAEQVTCFRDSKFRYINLEQEGEAFFADCEDQWKKKADQWGEAAARAGITYVVSHSPCVNAFKTMDEETFQISVRAIRRSLEICNILGIPRTVVHASHNPDFTVRDFYKQNKRYYGALFDLMEKYDITVMTENMDGAIYYPLSTGKEMREFIEYVDHPLFAGCWDTAHGNNDRKVKKAGQYRCILELGDKLKGLHVADNFGDGLHHHTWPFAGTVNFDSVMQGLLDVNYDGYFNFEASYTLLHTSNYPCSRQPWEYKGKAVEKLFQPSLELKKKAVDLLYETGRYMLETYNCFEF